MKDKGKDLVFDLADISTKAEILRGASDKLVDKVLMSYAESYGLDCGKLWSIHRDNTTYWRRSFRESKRRLEWGIALGTQGRKASLALEDGHLDKVRKNFGELQLVGYLSRLQAVTVEHISEDGAETQFAHGTIDCLRTTLIVRQDSNQVQASGFGPISYVNPSAE